MSQSGQDKKVDQLRKKIDSLDEELLRIISARAACAAEIAGVKRAQGLPEDQQIFYRPEREADILRRLRTSNPGPLSDQEIVRLFQELMSACLALEKPLTIGFLGPEATFTQQAALKHFGHSVQTIGLSSIEEVFRQTEKGQVEYGVVPVENSTEGVVSHTLDQFVTSPMKIVGEIQLRIHHHLLTNTQPPGDIHTIYSHPQSFAQCRRWLDEHYPRCEQIASSSTAAAALQASQVHGSAAICNESALHHYQLKVLHRNIEDDPNNRTRFLVIGRHTVRPSSHDKTSLLLSTRNKPGALVELLKSFSEHGVSLTRIESRPARRSGWEYVFFVDAAGHVEQEPLSVVVRQLEQKARLVKCLGSYPASTLDDSDDS